ncbi:MAG: hypothetical protein GX444_01445 [Myxococcales bacterium]|nr:hypothetical protein [Myxococcales bacterium]
MAKKMPNHPVEIVGQLGLIGNREILLALVQSTAVALVLGDDRQSSERVASARSNVSLPLAVELRGRRGRAWTLRRDGDAAMLRVLHGGGLTALDERTRRWRPGTGETLVPVAIYLPMPRTQETVDLVGPDLPEDLAATHLHVLLARRLASDPASPWFGRLRREPGATSGLHRRVSLGMMETALRRFLRDGGGATPTEPEQLYALVLAFWRAVAATFPNEWSDDRHGLLCKGLGLQVLVRLLTGFVCETPSDQLNESYFCARLRGAIGHVDWSNDGPLARLRGRSGVAQLHEELRRLTANLRVLLVDPTFNRRRHTNATTDETRWYPPLGLLKVGRLHLDRGDVVRFVQGRDAQALRERWDRVYVPCVFTWHHDDLVRTVKSFSSTLRDGGRVVIGGVGATLLADDIEQATGVRPVGGLLTSARQLGLNDDTNVDTLVPAYDLLDPDLYAVGETIYAYTTRGCIRRCSWCAVRNIEPRFEPYVDIKPMVAALRAHLGDPPRLLVMDNNVLASPDLARIVADLEALGYGRGQATATDPPRTRVVDFNQGVDARLVNERTVGLLARLNVQPLRIAFDRLRDKQTYLRAVRLAVAHGFKDISNYLLYNFDDSPRDLYERLRLNIELNAELATNGDGEPRASIACYPMRFAPVASTENRQRDRLGKVPIRGRDWLRDPAWTPLFMANSEHMKGAAGGSIPRSASLAYRVVGHNFEEFLVNLYAPKELLRHRNRHERRVYPEEPHRPPGTGLMEEFREFILGLLRKQDRRFRAFHAAVSPNKVDAVRETLREPVDDEVRNWLELYLKR